MCVPTSKLYAHAWGHSIRTSSCECSSFILTTSMNALSGILLYRLSFLWSHRRPVLTRFHLSTPPMHVLLTCAGAVWCGTTPVSSIIIKVIRDENHSIPSCFAGCFAYNGLRIESSGCDSMVTEFRAGPGWQSMHSRMLWATSDPNLVEH